MTEPQVSPTPSPAVEAILNDPEFQDLTRRKAALSCVLLVVTAVCYFAFVALLASSSPILARSSGGATLGLPLGVALLLLSWLVTGIYVFWANRAYDSAVARLRARHVGAASGEGAAR